MAAPPLPNHLAIILDGNGRWAVSRGLPRQEGHEQGAVAVRRIVRACGERGVPYLTLYTFSVANWGRPGAEVDTIMKLCERYCASEREELIERGVRVQVLGEIDDLPTSTRHAVEDLMAATRHGTGMVLSLALSYGGRRDMVHAMRAVAARARAGLLLPEEINEQSVREYLTTREVPDPDLVIRTGGVRRISDFLLFECAYAELVFTETFWPDFDEAALDAAIASYRARDRRFGGVVEQAALAEAAASC